MASADGGTAPDVGGALEKRHSSAAVPWAAMPPRPHFEPAAAAPTRHEPREKMAMPSRTVERRSSVALAFGGGKIVLAASCEFCVCGVPQPVTHNPRGRHWHFDPLIRRTTLRVDFPRGVALLGFFPRHNPAIQGPEQDRSHRRRRPALRSALLRARGWCAVVVQHLGNRRITMALGAQLEDSPDHRRLCRIDLALDVTIEPVIDVAEARATEYMPG